MAHKCPSSSEQSLLWAACAQFPKKPFASWREGNLRPFNSITLTTRPLRNTPTYLSALSSTFTCITARSELEGRGGEGRGEEGRGGEGRGGKRRRGEGRGGERRGGERRRGERREEEKRGGERRGGERRRGEGRGGERRGGERRRGERREEEKRGGEGEERRGEEGRGGRGEKRRRGEGERGGEYSYERWEGREGNSKEERGREGRGRKADCSDLWLLSVLKETNSTHIDSLQHCSSRVILCCLLFASSDPKGLVGVFISATNKGGVFVADRVRSNQLPNLGVLYANEREERLSECPTSPLPAERVRFEARVETELKQVGIICI